MRSKKRLGFYNSTEWKNCREAYKKQVGGICEECKKNGKLTAGEIVHHKEHISEDNLNNPRILLDFSNLQLVCRECHAKLHTGRRYKIDDLGRVITDTTT